VQRDVRDLARIASLHVLPRLLQLAAGQTARLLNVAELGGPFQLSRPTIRDYTTLRLGFGRRFLAADGARAGVVHAPLPKDDPVQRNPNITRAQELLDGWAPKVPLEDGLKATVEYFRGRQG